MNSDRILHHQLHIRLVVLEVVASPCIYVYQRFNRLIFGFRVIVQPRFDFNDHGTLCVRFTLCIIFYFEWMGFTPMGLAFGYSPGCSNRPAFRRGYIIWQARQFEYHFLNISLSGEALNTLMDFVLLEYLYFKYSVIFHLVPNHDLLFTYFVLNKGKDLLSPLF